MEEIKGEPMEVIHTLIEEFDMEVIPSDCCKSMCGKCVGMRFVLLFPGICALFSLTDTTSTYMLNVCVLRMRICFVKTC